MNNTHKHCYTCPTQRLSFFYGTLDRNIVVRKICYSTVAWNLLFGYQKVKLVREDDKFWLVFLEVPPPINDLNSKKRLLSIKTSL